MTKKSNSNKRNKNLNQKFKIAERYTPYDIMNLQPFVFASRGQSFDMKKINKTSQQKHHLPELYEVMTALHENTFARFLNDSTIERDESNVKIVSHIEVATVKLYNQILDLSDFDDSEMTFLQDIISSRRSSHVSNYYLTYYGTADVEINLQLEDDNHQLSFDNLAITNIQPRVIVTLGNGSKDALSQKLTKINLKDLDKADLTIQNKYSDMFYQYAQSIALCNLKSDYITLNDWLALNPKESFTQYRLLLQQFEQHF